MSVQELVDELNSEANNDSITRDPFMDDMMVLQDTKHVIKGTTGARDLGQDHPVRDFLQSLYDEINSKKEDQEMSLYDYRDEISEPDEDTTGSWTRYDEDNPGPFEESVLEERRDPAFVSDELLEHCPPLKPMEGDGSGAAITPETEITVTVEDALESLIEVNGIGDERAKEAVRNMMD